MHPPLGVLKTTENKPRLQGGFFFTTEWNSSFGILQIEAVYDEDRELRKLRSKGRSTAKCEAKERRTKSMQNIFFILNLSLLFGKWYTKNYFVVISQNLWLNKLFYKSKLSDYPSIIICFGF